MSRTAIIAVLLTACIDTGAATTTIPEPGTTIPGTEADSAFEPGDGLGLIGVEHGSIHRLAPQPGETGAGLELSPTEDGLVAVGSAWQTGDVVWERMRIGGYEGYIARTMLAFIGEPEDVTHLYQGVTAATMPDLGTQIATEIEAGRVVLVAQPGVDEVVYDVLGLDDDSIAGYRIRVVATGAANRLTAMLVERTPLCTRGISDGGRCL